MKQKLSISIDKNLIESLEEITEDGTFRNKSHVVEIALNKFIQEKKQNE